MKIWCLLSWYAEKPDWLVGMVESIAPLVDGLVCCDGPYPLAPHDHERSTPDQYVAIQQACARNRLEHHIYTPGALAEVDKRAFMFKAALAVAEPMRDWFLIMDADMYMGKESWPERARWYLEGTKRHAAEVTFHNLDPEIDGNPKVRSFRSLFRAIPGLTVEGTHSTYTVPDLDGERLLMWQGLGERRPVEALNLASHIHLYHRPHKRDAARQGLRRVYYDRRATANIEQVPTYD